MNTEQEIIAVRTYEEAVDIVVEWWVEKSFSTPLNQNNGDANVMGFMLMNLVSDNAKAELTQDKISKFKIKLKELLLKVDRTKYCSTLCDVDYHPNRILQEACDYSEVSSNCLPIKSSSLIGDDNKVVTTY